MELGYISIFFMVYKIIKAFASYNAKYKKCSILHI